MGPMTERHTDREASQAGKYVKFLAMIGTSMIVMFVLMYLHSYQLIDHAWFSETRLFMTMIMGGGMIVVMLAFMLHMYRDPKLNVGLIALAVLLVGGGIGLVRSQITVSGVDYMQGMIPHHSIAILTSERAQIEDPRVRELADAIIEAQRREIKEMEWLINDIRENGIARTREEAHQRPIPTFSGTPQ